MPGRRILTLLGCLLILACVLLRAPPAAAQSPCAVDVIVALEPDERDLLRPLVCEDSDAASAADARLDPILRKLVSRGGWAVDVALRAAAARARLDGAAAPCVEPSDAQSNPRAAQAWASCTLRALVAEPSCSLARRIELGLDTLRSDAFPPAIGAEDLAALDKGCRRKLGEAALDNLAARHVLVTYFGGPHDEVGAIIGAEHPWAAELVDYQGASGRAQLLVLPQGVPAGIVVAQDKLDIPWIKTLSPHADLALRPRAHECLALDFAVDPDWRGWSVFVDGREIEPSISTREDGSLRAEAMVHVPQGQGQTSNEVTVVDREGWSRTMSFEQSHVEGRCMPATADLSGRAHARYGLAKVTVEGCAGVVPAQISSAVGEYFAAHELELRQLDSLAEVVRAIAEVESTLGGGRAVGSPNVELDIHDIVADLAGETLRQGVTTLLTLELRCAPGHDEYALVGHAIDLRGFNERARSHITGVELGGLLEVRAVTVPERAGLHDGLDLVLGGLLECTAVQLVDPPELVDYYERVRLDYRVVHGGRCHADAVELGLAYVEPERDVGSLCNEIDERASLQSHRPELVGTRIDEIVAGQGEAELLLTRPLAEAVDVHDATALPLMRPGRYLVWVRTRDNRSVAARCFRAVSSRLSIYVQAGGGLVTPTNQYALRAELGTAHPFGRSQLGRIGPRVGYSLRGSAEDVRHALILGGYIGFDIPVSRCVHAPASTRHGRNAQAERCASVARRSWSIAGNVGVGGDLAFRRGNDVDLALQLMLEVQLDVRTSCYLFSRVNFLFGRALPSEGIRVLLLGAGIAWDIRKR